ncbi:hypothetical protein F5X99DRAFT_431142 [Biscogniauxia marginata]|nr:hypothetical protein F5X99DRAFT_431142 [Biscogniauxia marginata]
MDSPDAMQLFAARVLSRMPTYGAGDGQPVTSSSPVPTPRDLPVPETNGPLPPPGSVTPIFHPDSVLWPMKEKDMPVVIRGRVDDYVQKSSTVRERRCEMLKDVVGDLHQHLPEEEEPWDEEQRHDIVEKLTDCICFSSFAKNCFFRCEPEVRARLDRLFLAAFAGDSPDDFAVDDCLEMEQGLEPFLDLVFQCKPGLQPEWWENRIDYFEKKQRIYLDHISPDHSAENAKDGRDVDIPQSAEGSDELCPDCHAKITGCSECKGCCTGMLRPCCTRLLCSVCAGLLTSHECSDCISTVPDDEPDMDVDGLEED